MPRWVFKLVARVERSWIEASFAQIETEDGSVESYIEHGWVLLRPGPRAARAVPRVRSFPDTPRSPHMSLYLEDIERIRQLKYRYWRSIDTA